MSDVTRDEMKAQAARTALRPRATTAAEIGDGRFLSHKHVLRHVPKLPRLCQVSGRYGGQFTTALRMPSVVYSWRCVTICSDGYIDIFLQAIIRSVTSRVHIKFFGDRPQQRKIGFLSADGAPQPLGNRVT